MTSFFTLDKFIMSIGYNFLIYCGYFELSRANGILKQCHIAGSDKSLKGNHYINVLQWNYFIQGNTSFCKNKFMFCI